jgi:hypothetical protein
MIKRIRNTGIYMIVTFLCSVSAVHAQDPELFRPLTYPEGSKIELVQERLPSGSWQAILAEVIKLVLSITGSLTFIALTYGGIMFLTARGNDEQITKAKDVVTWSAFALAVIAISYAVVLGITQLRFF